MGLAFACGRCWDYDCKCTPEELAEYERQVKDRQAISTFKYNNPIYPDTQFIAAGDIIMKAVDKETGKAIDPFYVGIITNDNKIMGSYMDPHHESNGYRMEWIGPYLKLCATSQIL